MNLTHYKEKKQSTSKKRYRHDKGRGCIICDGKLVTISTDNRDLTNLEEKVSLSIYVSKCSNPECINSNKRLKPVSYLNQIVPYSGYGVDVYGLIGQLRLKNRHTIPEIHQHIKTHYEHIEIGERHVENIVKHIELCLEQSGKNASQLREYFGGLNQEGLILTVDGLEPEKGHSILYIVREVTTGKILMAHYATYQDAINLKKEILLPLKEIIKEAKLKVVGWQADKELAMGKAIQEVFEGVPFQHCQSHFLAAMKKPLTEADTILGKQTKKTLVS